MKSCREALSDLLHEPWEEEVGEKWPYNHRSAF